MSDRHDRQDRHVQERATYPPEKLRTRDAGLDPVTPQMVAEGIFADLGALDDEIARLTDKLAPVLLEPCEEDCAKAGYQATSSPLGNTLLEVRMRLNLATSRIRSVTGRTNL